MRRRLILGLAMALALAGASAGCSGGKKEGPMEKAGRQLDQAGDEMAKKARELSEEGRLGYEGWRSGERRVGEEGRTRGVPDP